MKSRTPSRAAWRGGPKLYGCREYCGSRCRRCATSRGPSSGSSHYERRNNQMTTGVAAFDFDGTLSTRDNLAPFLRAVVGPRALFRAIMLTAPHLARAAVDDVLATELAVGDDGRVSGELAGANVRRREKVRRLEAWMARELAPDRAVLWAYGDSAGDRELLARADYPVRITRRALLG